MLPTIIRRFRQHLLPTFLSLAFLSLFFVGTNLYSETILGTQGASFTINGRPQFLIGISAFDAIGHMKDAELDKLHQRGFRLIRVWGYWEQVILNSQSPTLPSTLSRNILFRTDGSLDPQKLSQLKDLLQRTDRRGMVIDMTVFNAFTSFDGNYLEKSLTGLKQLTTALKGHRNLLFDVYNEHNNHGRTSPNPISHEQLGTFVKAVKDIDPDRIVTFSNTHREPGGEVGDELAKEYLAELSLGIDCFTPHLPRTPDFAARTGERVRWIRALMKSHGEVMPLYLQEEARRRHSHLNPTAAEFFEAARSAKKAGAAAWVFHTDAGYNFGLGTLFERLDPTERSVVDRLAKELETVQYQEAQTKN
jgi:hypothetical protein